MSVLKGARPVPEEDGVSEAEVVVAEVVNPTGRDGEADSVLLSCLTHTSIRPCAVMRPRFDPPLGHTV